VIPVNFAAHCGAAPEAASNGALPFRRRNACARRRRRYDFVADLFDPESALSALFAP
jgi:hypothetical protein